MSDKYEVIEQAGTDKEVVVFECGMYSRALTYISDHYFSKEIEEMGVDILKNGSSVL